MHGSEETHFEVKKTYKAVSAALACSSDQHMTFKDPKHGQLHVFIVLCIFLYTDIYALGAQRVN